MRIVFMGSAALACPCLDAFSDEELVGVLTQPARPRGRRLHLGACPVKIRADERGLEVLTPAKVNTPESVAAVRSLCPDVIVVVAYGQILRPELLTVPARGCINMHASLLPAHRGAAPIQWAIARGETVTGVTVMYVNERMDAGDIIAQRRVAIGPDDTAGELHERLAAEGAVLLRETIDAMDAGPVTGTPQDAVAATFAPKLSKEDGRIDWALGAQEIHNRVRGFSPWPGCFCMCPVGASRLRVLHASAEDRPARTDAAVPGEIVGVGKDGPLVATGDGRAVRLRAVQPEGRKAMTGVAYLCGHALSTGAVMG